MLALETLLTFAFCLRPGFTGIFVSVDLSLQDLSNQRHRFLALSLSRQSVCLRLKEIFVVNSNKMVRRKLDNFYY